MKKVFVVYATDNVGTAVLEPIQTGDHVSCNGERSDLKVIAQADIAYGHKIALMDIAAGDTVLKIRLEHGLGRVAISSG